MGRRAGAEILGHRIADLQATVGVFNMGDGESRACSRPDGQPCLIVLRRLLLQPPNELRLVSRPQNQDSCHLEQYPEPPLLDQTPKELEPFRPGKLKRSIGNNNLVIITIHWSTLDSDADQADGSQRYLNEVQCCGGDNGKTINR
jgi:hypothetical protein